MDRSRETRNILHNTRTLRTSETEFDVRIYDIISFIALSSIPFLLLLMWSFPFLCATPLRPWSFPLLLFRFLLLLLLRASSPFKLLLFVYRIRNLRFLDGPCARGYFVFDTPWCETYKDAGGSIEGRAKIHHYWTFGLPQWR